MAKLTSSSGLKSSTTINPDNVLTIVMTAPRLAAIVTKVLRLHRNTQLLCDLRLIEQSRPLTLDERQEADCLAYRNHTDFTELKRELDKLQRMKQRKEEKKAIERKKARTFADYARAW